MGVLKLHLATVDQLKEELKKRGVDLSPPDGKTKEFKGTLKFRSVINVETSYTNSRVSNDTESTIEVEVNEDGSGWFEWSVPDHDLFQTGCLVFEGNMLTDYDGIFSLPKQLTDYLKENGYTMDEFIEDDEDI